MKHAALAAIAIFVAAGADARQAGEAPQPAPPAQAQEPQKAQRPPIYDESADAKQQVAGALAKAGKENRRVLIQWGANWCGWCHILHATFESNKDVSRKLLYEYDVVLVDIGKWSETDESGVSKNSDLVRKYGADLKGNGVPFLTILDAQGKVLANQETGSLEAKTADGKNGHDAGKIVAFLTKYQAEYLPASQVLDDGLAKARAANKLVFLHFGAPWCGWCHKLEDWSSRPDVAPILAKDFTDVKIDVDRTVGGKDVLARYNPESKGGIPWFVILDADGKAVMTSDGPAGNIGHPVKPEEIDHFIAMMKKSARAMTEADIATLRASLVEGAKQLEQR